MIRRDFLRMSLTGAGGAVMSQRLARGGPGAQSESSDRSGLEIGPGPHLLLDEALIAQTEGLTRVVHRPERLDQPVLDSARFGTTQPYLSVIADPAPDRPRFRIWYNRGPAIWHAESDDGFAWRDPHVAWDLSRGYCASVIDDRDHGTDRQRRFKLANWQSTRKLDDSPRDDGGMYLGASPDGLNWSALPGNPALPTWPVGWQRVVRHGVGDTVDLFYDPIHQQYGAAVKVHALPEDGYAPAPKSGRIFRRLVGMSTSRDFVHWERPWRIFTPDDRDEGLLEFYGMAGVHARGPLLIGFVRVLRDDLPCDAGGPADGIGYSVLATSRDGIHWRRDREPFLDRNPERGSWDHAMSWIGGVLPLGNEFVVYYGGYARGHKIAPERERQIGLARLPLDRYVSRAANAKGGALLTVPLVLAGERLRLNVQAHGGTIHVRLRDEAGRPWPGFHWSDAAPVAGDHHDAEVCWRDGAALPKGATARLEFRLTSAELFGFRFA